MNGRIDRKRIVGFNVEVVFCPPDVIDEKVRENPLLYEKEECEQFVLKAREIVGREHLKYIKVIFEGKLKTDTAILLIHRLSPYERTFHYDGIEYKVGNGYTYQKNRYIYDIPSGNILKEWLLDDLRGTVLHEMCHEFENYYGITKEGEAAFQDAIEKFCHNPNDKDHAQAWFSAVVFAAQKLDLAWEELYDRIKTSVLASWVD